MAGWSTVTSYWNELSEFASKHLSVKRVIGALAIFTVAYFFWKNLSVSSPIEVNFITNSKNDQFEKKMIQYLTSIFKRFEVPPFAEGNGSYFCAADTETEEFKLAYESAKKLYPFISPIYKRIILCFNYSSLKLSLNATILRRNIESNIRELDRHPQKIRNSTEFETNFENHLQILNDASEISDKINQLSEQINKISYDNLTVSSLNLTQSYDAMKSKLAQFPPSFKKVTEALNSISGFFVESRKKRQIEYPQCTGGNESGSLNTDKTILIEKLSQEIEEKKSTVQSEFDNIIRVFQQSKYEYQSDFMNKYSLDASYLNVSYLSRSVMYKAVLKFIKVIFDEYVSNQQQN